MKTIRNFARFLIAPIFIYSGFVKAVDPYGSAYKFSDYFEAFGFDFLVPISFVLAIVLSTAELVIGLSLLMGIVMRVTSWVLLLFMSFFTVLTLISAITNPVTDCGCFGDALILTNWQTFTKNIIFMLPTLVVFLGRKYYKSFTMKGVEWSMAILFSVLVVLISITAYRNLPMLDFRPYKIGTHIPSDMIIPEGEPLDEYENIFIYENKGIQKEFSLENIPYSDSTWKFVDRKSIKVKEGYKPPIHDFTISTLDGEDITDSVLTDKNYSFIIVAYDLSKSSKKGLNKVNEFAGEVSKYGAKVYGLTASTSSEINELSSKGGLNYKFHITDDITLKTIVRANPGVFLLKEGTIIGKWHYRNLPEFERLERGFMSISLDQYQNTKANWVIGFFIMGMLALVFLLVVLVKS